MAKQSIKKVQSKVPTDLVEHVEKQADYKSMNSYIKKALISKSKFKKATT